MRLHALRLQNFRQHVDTHIAFTTGLTGIIGPNGAGKSTVLEAIAWALYGNSAARGTRDSIRFSRARERAPVRVELDFELAGHRYRVERSLSSADVYLDGGEAPIATTIRGANELLQRRLGMSRAEFFNTYFTGQKELDIMAALGPTERGKFLSRVLGYDRLGTAQELVRERRRALVAELTGLRDGMPDAAAVGEQELTARAALDRASARVAEVTTQLAEANVRLATVTPVWARVQDERDQQRALIGECRVLQEQHDALARDVTRLEEEEQRALEASVKAEPLLLAAAALNAERDALAAMDTLASAEGTRQAQLARLRTLEDESARLNERLGKLETAPALEQEQVTATTQLRTRLVSLERELDEARTAWARDRQEAETRLDALRTQYAELTAQRETLEGLGAESPCPTCGRPLGASFQGVLDLVTEQLEAVTADGSYYRQRVEQLQKLPEAIEQREARRAAEQQELSASERRLARIQAALHERDQLSQQAADLARRIDESKKAVADLPTGYNAEQHAALRATVARLADMDKEAARYAALSERVPALQRTLREARTARHEAATRLAAADAACQAIVLDEETLTATRTEFSDAQQAVRTLELALVEARGLHAAATSEVAAAERARAQLDTLQRHADALDTERRLHEELDRSYSDLRADLNSALRPELAELAGNFLETLTDGRYASLELDEDYAVQVLEDGLPKPVLSGGEEDLCNLVLRLAISQMIAERAGQAFSLLVLDEVFGSLDETRRDNVVELLRRLHDRFEQVIVITHIDDVREGLDRVLSVRYDEEHGSSAVVAMAGGAVGSAAAAWEAELNGTSRAGAASDHEAEVA